MAAPASSEAPAPDHALRRPPSLTPLYVKAALTGALRRGAALPPSTYTLAERPIDPRHVLAYQRVCGFAVSDVLPPTYLHVLAFPLSVALMTEPSFPFPLVGLVHVANSITVRRPVRSAEAVSFTVRADNLRQHPAGRQFDLLAEAAVEGEVVWSGVSTYLRRGKRSADGAKRERPETAPFDGAAARVRVPADIGRRYGNVSGDRNPIHVSALSARMFGFPSAIAHGMWLKARALAALEGRLPDAHTTQVSFKLPVLLPATVLIGALRQSQGWLLDARSRAGKPHLVGTVTG